jgi:hypothetical protein
MFMFGMYSEKNGPKMGLLSLSHSLSLSLFWTTHTRCQNNIIIKHENSTSSKMLLVLLLLLLLGFAALN